MEVNKDQLEAAIRAADELARALRNLKKFQIGGWSVYTSGGFIKASRRISGRVFSLHVGKSPQTTGQIEKKIHEFEQKIGDVGTVFESLSSKRVVDET